jgi:hypothetical protein
MAAFEAWLSGTGCDSCATETHSNVVSNQEWSKPQTQGAMGLQVAPAGLKVSNLPPGLRVAAVGFPYSDCQPNLRRMAQCVPSIQLG